MTTASEFYLHTVSLNDDDSPSSSSSSSTLVDQLEAQPTPKLKTHELHVPKAIAEADDENSDEGDDNVVVIVDHAEKQELSKPRPTLPPLRVPDMVKELDLSDGDYVDPTLFSPEVSRHSLEQAHRRARTLESELKEMMMLEGSTTRSAVKITPIEAVSIISSAFVTSVARVRSLVTGDESEYDLLAGTSPSNKIDDLDADGDGLQLSPDASRGDGKHFQTPKLKPALKRISAYSNIEKEQPKDRPSRPSVKWHEEVLDQDEEFVDEDDDGSGIDGETELLMVNGGGNSGANSAISNRQATPRSKKKRKKITRSVMRRLTPREKEELYRQRPDLMIIPNWAQKYREEMAESDSARWSFWLISVIGTLVILLVVLIVLIARDRAAAATN
ncbi:hypothetical protein P43SY_007469 [Pythium insidiosum]|uniref:Transmembrane protein n=1 Tax=Pythium insidiosum TaxID=114742 RepID=A0AAD5LTZ5_PYTIN|nr:hypothetical protein P43SY_007469 [Pythium insidiosum]